MFNFRSLKCNKCGSVLLNLPLKEILKLNGLTFRCDYCDHLNTIKSEEFNNAQEKDSVDTFSFLSSVRV